VAEGARGQGIGAALLRFAEERFAGRRHVFLLVSSFNARAQKFYQEHGYARVGEIQDYIVPGKSELIYHKRLR
jgi:ribosomal protein S18 acetylase RimI-like enzyme